VHRQEKQHAKAALFSIALIACSCIVLSAILVTTGKGGNDVVELFVSYSSSKSVLFFCENILTVHCQGGFTSHLDLDHGALAALEATAGQSNDDGDEDASAFSDASPRVPQVLSAQLQRQTRAVSLRSQGRDEMLSDESSSEERKREAEEGLHTQDYNVLTDAAGTM
jgi:hypothetical protein